MLTKGGHTVQAGTYWNMGTRRVDMAQEACSGRPAGPVHQGPAAMAIAAGPVLGPGVRTVPPLHRDRDDAGPGRQEGR